MSCFLINPSPFNLKDVLQIIIFFKNLEFLHVKPAGVPTGLGDGCLILTSFFKSTLILGFTALRSCDGL